MPEFSRFSAHKALEAAETAHQALSAAPDDYLLSAATRAATSTKAEALRNVVELLSNTAR